MGTRVVSWTWNWYKINQRTSERMREWIRRNKCGRRASKADQNSKPLCIARTSVHEQRERKGEMSKTGRGGETLAGKKNTSSSSSKHVVYACVPCTMSTVLDANRVMHGAACISCEEPVQGQQAASTPASASSASRADPHPSTSTRTTSAADGGSGGSGSASQQHPPRPCPTSKKAASDSA